MEKDGNSRDVDRNIKLVDRKTFVDIINYKIFISIVIILTTSLILDVFIEQAHLELSTIILTIDVFCLFSAVYYVLYFMKTDLYPKMIQKIHLPQDIKKRMDEELFNKKTLLIASIVVFTIFALFFILCYDYIIQITKTLFFFILTIGVFVFLAVEILEGFTIAFSLITKIIHHRKEFIYKIGHEDNMGGSKEILEVYYKNIYPLFLIIIIIVAMLAQVTYGNIIIFNNLLPFDVQLAGIFILFTAIAVVLIGIFLTQILNHLEMVKFKDKEISRIENSLKELHNKIQKNNLDLKIRVEHLSQITLLQLEKENVVKMKTILISGSAIKKLIISLIGIIVSYTFNTLLNIIF